MWPLLIPLLTTRLYEFSQKKTFPLHSIQDLWVVSCYVLIYSVAPIATLLWAPLALYQLVRWYCLYRFQIPFSLELLNFLRAPRCFVDSIKELRLGKPCFIGALLVATSFTAFLTPPALIFWVPLFFLSSIAHLALRKRAKTNPKEPLPTFSFPHEISIPISPTKYPALRKTLAFLGEKKFHIPLLPKEKPHIIFFFLESFRAKNVGCLGASIPASPHFDAWAKRGLLFRNFHANGLQTFRSFISAYFGIPAHLQTTLLKPFCDLPLVGLPQILKKDGYHPAIIQSGDVSFDHLYPFFHSHGFQTILGAENIPTRKNLRNSWGIHDECMVRFAADFLEKQSDPTFLSLFTITNHHPWKSPSGWNFPIPQDLPPIYQNYLQTFAYTDHCLGLFLNLLDQKKLLDKSILFIAGDHGQEMYDRRAFFSEINHSLFEENIHLPLLILGGEKPAVFDNPASFIDFLPTVLDCLNIQDVHHSLGNSLMRPNSSPSYFSLQREEPKIGYIQDKKKIIIAPSQVLQFDLDKDPEEKCNIKISSDISHCSAYFHNIEAIYNANAWAPQSNIPYQIEATESMNDEKWLAHLHAHPPTSVVDLSASLRLSDDAIVKVDPTYAAYWHELVLANSVRFTDRSLEWIGAQCQNLMSLDLSHCHLLTNKGVRTILAECQELRHLKLDGIEDLTDFVPHNTLFNLHTCSLKQAPNIQGKTLVRLFLHSPHLIHWSACLEHATDDDLFKMSHAKKRCTHMILSQGKHIRDDALFALIASQEELRVVHLEAFPLLENPDFSPLQDLRSLDISDCPQLKDAFFDSIKHLPLIYLCIHNCPKITEKGLRLLAQNKNLQIYFA